MSPSVTSIVSKQSPLDRDQVAQPDAPKIADVKQGLDTSSDPRFVRFFWEMDPYTIARNRQDTFGPRVWIPFAKGGWLDKFHADISCVTYWKDDGEGKKFQNARRESSSPHQETWIIAVRVESPGCEVRRWEAS